VRILWAGYIQQIRKADFQATLELAQRVTSRRDDLEFTFSLKPEFYRAELADLGNERLKVVRGDRGFLQGLASFDGLLSPVLNAGAMLAPPLTWIEAMSAGLPVMTTSTHGIEEIIADGTDGIVRDTYADLERWLGEADVGTTLRSMRDATRATFETRYEIGRVADTFLETYEKALLLRK
jgi:glycosyltransferase involved in cell wall biosynthesis